MAEQFKDMWDSHVRRITTSRHRIDLGSDDIRPVYSAPHEAGQIVKKLHTATIDRMLIEDPNNRTTTKWGSPTDFALQEEGSLRSSPDYRKQDEVVIGGFLSVSRNRRVK